ncbi:hypothetical protein ACFXPY_45440 [Streptomyces sp. NPDC059153]|uniref:hypothetical protein n=1 Tax=Streptomyces sp. NPDC059153 TaxID=3346743 RepID=UPI0036B796AC
MLIALSTSSSAQAYPIQTFRGYASSSGYGFGAYEVNSDGYGVIYAMDTYADGYRIVSTVYNDTQGKTIAYVEDANGANDDSGPAVYDFSVHAGDAMRTKTCRQNGAAGTPVNCKTTYFSVPY